MKKTSWFVFCLGLGFILSACASGIKFTEAKPSLTAQKPEMGRIFFYRSALFGAAIQPEVRLNGEPVGTAIPEGYFYVDRPAGNYEVATTTEVERTLRFVLEKGETRFVRFRATYGFLVLRVFPELVDKDEGLSQIQDCKYTGNEAPAKEVSQMKGP